MALTRAWVGAGLGLRLLMLAVLAMSLRLKLANNIHTKYDFRAAGYNVELQSYMYAVAAALFGMVGGVLQVPVAVYLLCKSRRTTPSVLALDASMYADIVVTVVLASGAGAGFGATNDVVEYTKHASPWEGDAQQDLVRYYQKGSVAIVFLLVGMLLSLCATVVSTRLRARATDDDHLLGV
ncbi:hypothetical protein ACP70R_027260 [Stipagrostis hirtigluma subsp. patula]